MNLARVAHTLATFLAFLAGFLLVPAAVALAFDEWTDARVFVEVAAITAGIGLGTRFVFRRADRTLYRREGLLIVVGCWILAALVGALPFLFTGVTARFEDAFFESMSGFTTTGSSILTELGTYNHGIMFWRSLTHWLGGMGIVVLFVAILPALGVSARLLYEFESSGVDTEDLKPRIRETASLMWRIYVSLSVLQFLLLLACGLSAYDAAVHTFGTLSTGGLSPHASSIAHFDSTPVELIVIGFMFLGGTNFALFWRVRLRGLRALWSDFEFRWYAVITVSVSLIAAIALIASGRQSGVWQALLDATFAVVSVFTSTGYATENYDQWPNPIRLLLMILMFIGASAGSTCGGIKLVRFIILCHVIRHELRRFVRPRRVAQLVVMGQRISDEVGRNVLVFFAVAVLTIFGGALVLATLGHDLETSITAVMATLFCTGPGLGPMVGPAGSFAELHPLGKVLCSFLMLFGRLELFALLAILQPSFYRD